MSSGGYYFNAYNESARSNFIDDVASLANIDSIIDSPDYIINKEKFIDFFVGHDESSYEEVVNLLRCYYDPYICDIDSVDPKNNYLDYNHHLMDQYDLNKKTFVIDPLLNIVQVETNQQSNVNVHVVDKIDYVHLLNDVDINKLQTESTTINKIKLSEAAFLEAYNFINYFRKFKFMLPEIEMLISIFYNKFGEPTAKINPLNVAYDIGMLGDIINLTHDDELTHMLLGIKNNKRLFDNATQKIIKAKNLHRNLDHTEDDWKLIVGSLDSASKPIFEYTFAKLFKQGDTDKLKQFINCYSMKIIDDVTKEFSRISFSVLVKNFLTDIIGESEKQIIKNDKALYKIDSAESSIDNLKNFVHAHQLKAGIPYKNTILAASIKNKYSVTFDDDSIDIIKDIDRICALKGVEESLALGDTMKELFGMKSSFNTAELFNIAVKVWKRFLNVQPQIFSSSETSLYGNNRELTLYTINIKSTLNVYTNVLRNVIDKISNIISNDDTIKEIVTEYANNKLLFSKVSSKSGTKLLFNSAILRIVAAKANFHDEETNIFVHLPTCNISLQKEIGTIGETNIFAATLKHVNETLSSIINPPMKLAVNMINELTNILHLVAKINEFYGAEHDAGSSILYMYSQHLFSKMPKYCSKLSAIEGMFGEYNVDVKPIKYNNSHNLGKMLDAKLYKSIGYSLYTGIADCVESTIRDFINCLMLQLGGLDIKSLPQSTLPEIKGFYEKYKTLANQYLDEAREDWIKIFNGVIKKMLEEKYPNNKSTFFESRVQKYVDMESSFMTFTNALMIIFNIDGTTPLTHEDASAKDVCKDMLEKIATIFKKEVVIEFQADQNTMLVQMASQEFKIYDGHSQMKDIEYKDDKYIICSSIRQSKYYKLLKLILNCGHNRNINTNKITNADYIYFMSDNYNSAKHLDADEYVDFIVEIMPALLKYNLLDLFVENEAHHGKFTSIVDMNAGIDADANINKINIVTTFYSHTTDTLKDELVSELISNNQQDSINLLNIFAFHRAIFEHIVSNIKRTNIPLTTHLRDDAYIGLIVENMPMLAHNDLLIPLVTGYDYRNKMKFITNTRNGDKMDMINIFYDAIGINEEAQDLFVDELIVNNSGHMLDFLIKFVSSPTIFDHIIATIKEHPVEFSTGPYVIKNEKYIDEIIGETPMLKQYDIFDWFVQNELRHGIFNQKFILETGSENIAFLLYDQSAPATKYEICTVLVNSNRDRLADLLNLCAFDPSMLHQILYIIKRGNVFDEITNLEFFTESEQEHAHALSNLYLNTHLNNRLKDNLVESLVANSSENLFNLLDAFTFNPTLCSHIMAKIKERGLNLENDNLSSLLFQREEEAEKSFSNLMVIVKQMGEHQNTRPDDDKMTIGNDKMTISDLERIYYDMDNAHTANKLYLILMEKFVGNMEHEKFAYEMMQEMNDADKILVLGQLNGLNPQYNFRDGKYDAILLDKMKAANINPKIINYLKYRTIDKYDAGTIASADGMTMKDFENIYYDNENAHTANKLYLDMMDKFIASMKFERDAYKTMQYSSNKLWIGQDYGLHSQYDFRHGGKINTVLQNKMKAANIHPKIIDYLKYRTIDKYDDEDYERLKQKQDQIGGTNYYKKYKKYKSKYLSLKY